MVRIMGKGHPHRTNDKHRRIEHIANQQDNARWKELEMGEDIWWSCSARLWLEDYDEMKQEFADLE